MNSRSALAAVLSLALVASPALAEGGWGLPSLKPFAKKAGPPTSARVSDGSGGLKMPTMPKMWPTSGKTIVKKPAGPSAWQKMKSGTKSFMTKTADVLNPFDDAEDNEPQPQITGSNSYFSQAANGKSADKKPSTFLPSWWSGAEEDPEPKTVSDFLALPRPGY
jgi:hypothetical protein